MDSKIVYEYENYDIHYRRAQKAKQSSDYYTAYIELAYASKSLLLLAKMSNGELKTQFQNKANSIMNQAKKYKDMYETQKMSKDTNIFNDGKSGRKSKPINGDEDNTETIWESSEIPNVSLDDVAGLENVKQSVQMRVLLPIKHPEIFKKFKKKAGGGILLYGLPGTGKTMIAKAIAHEANANFYSIKCSDIVSKWFGEAEHNIKNLFNEARKHERAIIFFDEFEALATKRGGNSTVMNRIVPELLSQIQGFSDNNNKMLLLLAATNCPWAIDSAMLRPGRFNELIYVPLPDYEARLFIIKKNLLDTGIPLSEEISLEQMAEKLEGFNGSDVAEFCERLKVNPILRAVKTGDENQFVTIDDVNETLNVVHSSVQKDDIKALEKFIASQRN